MTILLLVNGVDPGGEGEEGDMGGMAGLTGPILLLRGINVPLPRKTPEEVELSIGEVGDVGSSELPGEGDPPMTDEGEREVDDGGALEAELR